MNECQVCFKTFSRRWTLKRHMRTLHRKPKSIGLPKTTTYSIQLVRKQSLSRLGTIKLLYRIKFANLYRNDSAEEIFAKAVDTTIKTASHHSEKDMRMSATIISPCNDEKSEIVIPFAKAEDLTSQNVLVALQSHGDFHICSDVYVEILIINPYDLA